MRTDYPLLFMLAGAAVLFIIYLIWRNITDKNDTDPDLTDELEKQRKDPAHRG